MISMFKLFSLLSSYFVISNVLLCCFVVVLFCCSLVLLFCSFVVLFRCFVVVSIEVPRDSEHERKLEVNVLQAGVQYYCMLQ